MARKTISELEDELAQERDDNARLYAKVNNLRAELAELDDPDDSVAEAEAGDSDDSDDSADYDPDPRD